jgi:nucleotidyltransferase substrate binding protein (TIGR01987 family)
MTNKDIRWIQRLANFKKALQQLSEFIEKNKLNKFEKQGLIQSFEYNYELSWNTIKDFYESQGETNIQGSKDAIRMAFKRGLIENGDIWMEMIKSRALTTHTYNEAVVEEITKAIFDNYYQEFTEIHKKLQELAKKENN